MWSHSVRLTLAAALFGSTVLTAADPTGELAAEVTKVQRLDQTIHLLIGTAKKTPMTFVVGPKQVVLVDGKEKGVYSVEVGMKGTIQLNPSPEISLRLSLGSLPKDARSAEKPAKPTKPQSTPKQGPITIESDGTVSVQGPLRAEILCSYVKLNLPDNWYELSRRGIINRMRPAMNGEQSFTNNLSVRLDKIDKTGVTFTHQKQTSGITIPAKDVDSLQIGSDLLLYDGVRSGLVITTWVKFIPEQAIFVKADTVLDPDKFWYSYNRAILVHKSGRQFLGFEATSSAVQAQKDKLPRSSPEIQKDDRSLYFRVMLDRPLPIPAADIPQFSYDSHYEFNGLKNYKYNPAINEYQLLKPEDPLKEQKEALKSAFTFVAVAAAAIFLGADALGILPQVPSGGSPGSPPPGASGKPGNGKGSKPADTSRGPAPKQPAKPTPPTQTHVTVSGKVLGVQKGSVIEIIHYYYGDPLGAILPHTTLTEADGSFTTKCLINQNIKVYLKRPGEDKVLFSGRVGTANIQIPAQ